MENKNDLENDWYHSPQIPLSVDPEEVLAELVRQCRGNTMSLHGYATFLRLGEDKGSWTDKEIKFFVDQTLLNLEQLHAFVNKIAEYITQRANMRDPGSNNEE